MIFNRKNQINFFAPVDGKVLKIQDIPDKMFAQKMAGDGIGIIPTNDIATSPANGQISLIFKTNHAFILTTSSGLEILVHIGIDTVSLNGNGFEPLVQQGDHVKTGTPIIKFDREIIEKSNCSPIVIILATNIDNVDNLTSDTHVISGKSVIFSCNNKLSLN